MIFKELRKKLININTFFIAGLPSFIIALLLNYMLVEWIHLSLPLAYALVIIIQLSINFFMYKHYVFNNEAETTLLIQYLQYISGVIIIRFFDWLLYSILTQALPVHFTLIQLGNVILFFFLKYRLTKRIIEGR